MGDFDKKVSQNVGAAGITNAEFAKQDDARVVAASEDKKKLQVYMPKSKGNATIESLEGDLLVGDEKVGAIKLEPSGARDIEDGLGPWRRFDVKVSDLRSEIERADVAGPMTLRVQPPGSDKSFSISVGFLFGEIVQRGAVAIRADAPWPNHTDLADNPALKELVESFTGKRCDERTSPAEIEWVVGQIRHTYALIASSGIESIALSLGVKPEPSLPPLRRPVAGENKPGDRGISEQAIDWLTRLSHPIPKPGEIITEQWAEDAVDALPDSARKAEDERSLHLVRQELISLYTEIKERNRGKAGRLRIGGGSAAPKEKQRIRVSSLDFDEARQSRNNMFSEVLSGLGVPQVEVDRLSEMVTRGLEPNNTNATLIIIDGGEKTSADMLDWMVRRSVTPIEKHEVRLSAQETADPGFGGVFGNAGAESPMTPAKLDARRMSKTPTGRIVKAANGHACVYIPQLQLAGSSVPESRRKEVIASLLRRFEALETLETTVHQKTANGFQKVQTSLPNTVVVMRWADPVRRDGRGSLEVPLKLEDLLNEIPSLRANVIRVPQPTSEESVAYLERSLAIELFKRFAQPEDTIAKLPKVTIESGLRTRIVQAYGDIGEHGGIVGFGRFQPEMLNALRNVKPAGSYVIEWSATLTKGQKERILLGGHPPGVNGYFQVTAKFDRANIADLVYGPKWARA
jgi:hypothetical protein